MIYLRQVAPAGAAAIPGDTLHSVHRSHLVSPSPLNAYYKQGFRQEISIADAIRGDKCMQGHRFLITFQEIALRVSSFGAIAAR